MVDTFNHIPEHEIPSQEELFPVEPYSPESGITYYTDDENPFHDDEQPELRKPLLPITIDFDDKMVPKNMTRVVSEFPVPITTEFLDNFDLESDNLDEGQRSVLGGIANAVRNGIDRLPPLVSTDESNFTAAVKPLSELTPEDRIAVLYEAQAVARPTVKLLRAMGLRDLATPTEAERNIRLHSLELEVIKQEQQPGHELLSDKGKDK